MFSMHDETFKHFLLFAFVDILTLICNSFEHHLFLYLSLDYNRILFTFPKTPFGVAERIFNYDDFE